MATKPVCNSYLISKLVVRLTSTSISVLKLNRWKVQTLYSRLLSKLTRVFTCVLSNRLIYIINKTRGAGWVQSIAGKK